MTITVATVEKVRADFSVENQVVREIVDAIGHYMVTPWFSDTANTCCMNDSLFSIFRVKRLDDQ